MSIGLSIDSRVLSIAALSSGLPMALDLHGNIITCPSGFEIYPFFCFSMGKRLVLIRILKQTSLRNYTIHFGNILMWLERKQNHPVASKMVIIVYFARQSVTRD